MTSAFLSLQLSILLLFFYYSFLVYGSRVRCIDVGDCVSCSAFELNEEYCKETKKKIKISCKGYGSRVDDYRSCQVTAEDDQNRVLLFQATMAVLGGLAYWGVRARKMQNMTRFESRKQSNSSKRSSSRANLSLI